MKNNKLADRLYKSVLRQATRIMPPVNYHQGLALPCAFELPNNILCFFHDFPNEEVQHNRYCIVIPFDPLVYVLNGCPRRIESDIAVTQHPYAAHGIRPVDGRCRRLQISFDLHEKPDFFPDNDYSPMSTAGWKIVARILRAFHRHDTAECAFEVYHLCKELKGDLPCANRRQSVELKAKVEDITEFRRDRRENIKSIAARLQISESNLRLRFRRENGMTLGKFLQKQKMEGALYRLQFTRQTITEISMVCGYDSVVSFCRFFKKQTGMSPLKWRKMHLKHFV